MEYQYKCPQWDDFPDIDLYMDQVVGIIDKKLAVLFDGTDEKFATSTMINNYVKGKIISPPINKKYSRVQISQLYIIFMLKKVLSISEISIVLEYLKNTRQDEELYTSFKEVFDKAFAYENLDGCDEVLSCCALALRNKLNAEKILEKYKKPFKAEPDQPKKESVKPKRSKKKKAMEYEDEGQ